MKNLSIMIIMLSKHVCVFKYEFLNSFKRMNSSKTKRAKQNVIKIFFILIDYIILCFKLSLFYSFKKIAFDFYYFLCSALITPVSNDFCLKKEAYAQPKQTFASNMFC